MIAGHGTLGERREAVKKTICKVVYYTKKRTQADAQLVLAGKKL